MPIKNQWIIICIMALTQPVLAAEPAAHMGHGDAIFHKFKLELEAIHKSTDDDITQSWDFEGWIGTDDDKLWLKSEGDRVNRKLESTEFQALYSRNVAEFWDVQAGLRYDSEPESTAYAVLGVEGTAPYFLDTEAHLFFSEHGDVTARVKKEAEFLLTQQWALEPYVEASFAAQKVPEQDLGAGITDGKFGIKSRYDLSKRIAPYVDIAYKRKFGETAAIARRDGDDPGAFISAVGIKLMF